MLNPRRIDQAVTGGLSRRSFVTTTIGGAVGLALLPGVASAQAPKPGSKPTEQPLAFVTIAKDGTTTILCNRMDMGQGVETGLAMICAEELDADWSKVRTGFGDQKAAYVDPLFGIHLTGGSNSIKNSYQQYRELGARTRAMLVAAAAESWGVPASSLKAENGIISGAGKSAGYGEFFDSAMKGTVPEAVTLKDPKSFKLIGKPTGLVVSKAKSTGTQAYGMDVQLPGMAVAVIQRPPVFNGKVAKLDSSEALKVASSWAVAAKPKTFPLESAVLPSLPKPGSKPTTPVSGFQLTGVPVQREPPPVAARAPFTASPTGRAASPASRKPDWNAARSVSSTKWKKLRLAIELSQATSWTICA